jgi:hypothetical protein
MGAETSELSAAHCKIKCQETANCAAYTFITGDCFLFTAANAYSGSQTHNMASAYSGVLEQAYTQTGWLQAGAASEMVDFDTTSLTANVLYTVCYGDVAVPAAGAPGAGVAWTDSGIRLRFIKWTNPEKSRVASGAATLLSFSINYGTFDTSNDYFALIKNGVDCTGAPGAPLLSDGSQVKKLATYDSGAHTQSDTGTYGFAMPSGTSAGYRATGWRTCRPVLQGPQRLDMSNYEACDEPGLYQDTNLEEGTYVVCFCDSDNGNSGCDQSNEWIKLSSSAVNPDMLKVVQTPRLGRAYSNFDATSHVGSVRAISQKSQTYNIKTSDTAGLEIANDDKIYFKATACDSIPSVDATSETAPISVTSYDSNSLSATYKAARVVTPSGTPLQSSGSNPRDLVSCFATVESLSEPPSTTGIYAGSCDNGAAGCTCDAAQVLTCSGAGTCDGLKCTGGKQARDYVKLVDGLEVVPKPRLGTNQISSDPGVIRSITGASPVFEAMSFKAGDKLFFKEMSTFNYQLTGFLEMPSSGVKTFTASALNQGTLCSPGPCGTGGVGSALSAGFYNFAAADITVAAGSAASAGSSANIRLRFSTTNVIEVLVVTAGDVGSGYLVGNTLTISAAAILAESVGTTTDFVYTLTESDLASPYVVSGDYVLCDYANGETCSCSNVGALSCSNAAHSCSGFSCTNTIPEGADTDCTDGTIAVSGDITQVVPNVNSGSGTTLIAGSAFFDAGASGNTVTHVVRWIEGKYSVDGTSQLEIAASVGNTYIFNLDQLPAGRLNGGLNGEGTDDLNDHPLLFSMSVGIGSAGEAVDSYTTGVTYTLDGQVRTQADYLMYFASAQTRSITFVPTQAVELYYYSYRNEDLALIREETSDNPNVDLHRYVQTNIGGKLVVNRDDAGLFQLPTDVPLTSSSATVPRFLTACFIPAGTIESLHAPSVANNFNSNCSYYNPHDSTCTKSLVNAQRLEDYLQVLPEPTDNLKESHNKSAVYSLQFNEPQFGTFWRATNHWCAGNDQFTHPCGVRQSDRNMDGSSSLCCESSPNFAAGSPDDVIVLKKEDTKGSGDCVGVESITDSDYFIGAQYSRKMTLSTIDDDRTTQTSPYRSDLTQGELRAAADKGAEASHHTIADGKVNELPEGFYTICYATAESGADDNADFKKLSKSIEILPKTATGPYIEIPRTVLLGHNINVRWAANSGYQNVPSESHSWIGLFKSGECANDSGEFQNKCFLAAQTVDDGMSGEGTITFSANDYKLTVGRYEVRYFDGTSRDNHGVLCRGMPNVARGTYINCVYESVITSSAIIVYADINQMDDLSAGVPGLEMVFDGALGRYAGKGAGLPGSDNDGFQRPFNQA